MKIPRHWAKGTAGSTASCWRWSDLSADDAQRQANVRAAELARMIESGAPLHRYGYGEHALREEIIQTLSTSTGRDTNQAVITRNAHGVLVLNTSSAMFIDIDFAARSTGHGAIGVLKRLLRGSQPPLPEAQAMQKIQAWAATRPDLGLQIYRTAGGIRCLITNTTFDVSQSSAMEILDGVGSDPLYVRLCKAQACFRARLTPKPWRCAMRLPPSRYPWLNSADEAAFRKWQTDYDRAIQGYTVCRFLRHIGPTAVHAEISPILQLHDRFSCGPVDRPLA